MVWQKTSVEDLLCVFFLSRETVSLSLCFFVTEQTLNTGSKLCQAESQMGFYRTCQAVVSNVPEFTAKLYSAIKHRPDLTLNKETG